MANRRTNRAVGIGGVGLVALGAATLLLSGGCYEKVTRAEGFGADRITTEDPNRNQGPVDKLIFGEDQNEVIRER